MAGELAPCRVLNSRVSDGEQCVVVTAVFTMDGWLNKPSEAWTKRAPKSRPDCPNVHASLSPDEAENF